MRLGLGLGLGASGRIWAPPAASALEMWLDAGHGITLGGGGGVATWADRAGKHDATQATQAKQPTVVASAQNGLPGVAFTGLLHLTHTLRLQKPCTVAAVAKTTVDGSAGYAGIASFGAGLGGVFVFADASGITQWGLYQNGNVLSGQSIRNAFKRVTAVVRDYNDVDLRTNGASATVAAGVSAYNAMSLIGAGVGGGGQSLDGTLLELMAWSRVLSVAECRDIETYFGAKYAL